MRAALTPEPTPTQQPRPRPPADPALPAASRPHVGCVPPILTVSSLVTKECALHSGCCTHDFGVCCPGTGPLHRPGRLHEPHEKPPARTPRCRLSQ